MNVMPHLTTITGADLPPLGWQHTEPLNLDHIQPVTLRPMFPIKPHGGLWTSPMRDGKADWTRWCEGERFGAFDAPVTAVIPDRDARVFVIDRHADLLALEAAYPDPQPEIPAGIKMWPSIDWAAVARDIDAVWLTEAGQWATRFSQPGLYGWDCETVFWLNPRLRVGDVLDAKEAN